MPRYGPRVVGGAETLCRMLAEDLTANGTPVDVLTTCAVDHFSWDDRLPVGQTIENGVSVRRFPVGPRNPDTFRELHGAIGYGARLSYGEQLEWMANSVWAPGIIDASGDYDWLIAMPYLFGTTFWSAVSYPDRTVMIPCLHDEHHARVPLVLDAITSCRGVMLNARGEGELLDRMLAEHRGGRQLRSAPAVVGGGFDEQPLPTADEVSRFCARHRTEPGYLLYAGRREEAKGLPALYAHYRLYRETSPDPLPLALMGSGDTGPPPDISPYVIDLGFVPTEERTLAYAGATALVHPSRLESFGLVLFEAWLAGTPAIVNGASDVLRDHCADSNGGLWYHDGPEFCETVEMLVRDPAIRQRLASAGREYTLTEFQWGAVRGRLLGALAAMA